MKNWTLLVVMPGLTSLVFFSSFLLPWFLLFLTLFFPLFIFILGKFAGKFAQFRKLVRCLSELDCLICLAEVAQVSIYFLTFFLSFFLTYFSSLFFQQRGSYCCPTFTSEERVIDIQEVFPLSPILPLFLTLPSPLSPSFSPNREETPSSNNFLPILMSLMTLTSVGRMERRGGEKKSPLFLLF